MNRKMFMAVVITLLLGPVVGLGLFTWCSWLAQHAITQSEREGAVGFGFFVGIVFAASVPAANDVWR